MLDEGSFALPWHEKPMRWGGVGFDIGAIEAPDRGVGENVMICARVNKGATGC